MFDGSIIKKLRNEINLNQKELAEKVDCTQANISSYENNRTRPDVDVLIKMSKIFDKSTDYILGINKPTIDDLDENELFIIDVYRSLRPESKNDFISMAKMIKTLRGIQKENIPNDIEIK